MGLSSIFHAYLAVVRVSACRRRSGGRAGKEGNNGHLDGIKAVGDRLRGWREDGTYSRNFTAFAVVYLDHVPAPHGGNFTVWPKSHHFFEDYFKEHGHRCWMITCLMSICPKGLSFQQRKLVAWFLRIIWWCTRATPIFRPIFAMPWFLDRGIYRLMKSVLMRLLISSANEMGLVRLWTCKLNCK